MEVKNAMKAKLARGMTVQSAGVGEYRYAYCVRCQWQSNATSFRVAKIIACSEDSHQCNPPVK